MKCRNCPQETARAIGSILGGLCNSCVTEGLAEAHRMQKEVSAFAAKYRHSPAFVLEFGAWAISGRKLQRP